MGVDHFIKLPFNDIIVLHMTDCAVLKLFLFEYDFVLNKIVSMQRLVRVIDRWMLLCFKREFVESDALRLWEACWARHQTDYFHLFVCAAVIAVYGEDVVQQDLMADEMLLHFSSLSMLMSGEVVLRKVQYISFFKQLNSTLLFAYYYLDMVGIWKAI